MQIFLALFITVFQTVSYSKHKDSKLTQSVLKVGESRLINQISPIDFFTSIKAQYRLTKISEKQYRSEIGINLFTKDPTITSDDLLNFRGRIQECLSEASNLLNGPNNENLEIILAKNNSTFPSSAVVQIEVSKKLSRERSNHYALSTNCSTIVHEILLI